MRVIEAEKTAPALLPCTYYFSLFHVIEEDKITEHCYKAEKPETCHNVYNCVLQVKFPCNKDFLILILKDVRILVYLLFPEQ